MYYYNCCIYHFLNLNLGLMSVASDPERIGTKVESDSSARWMLWVCDKLSCPGFWCKVCIISHGIEIE